MSNLIAPGVQALSVFRDDTGTTHQLNGKHIAPGGYVRRTEINSRITPSGSDRYVTETWEALINHHDATFANHIDAAMRAAEAKWQLCVAGFSQVILWYEESYLLEPERATLADPSSTDAPFQMLMRQTRYKPKIKSGINLVAVTVQMEQDTAYSWRDDDNDDIADGWVQNETTGQNFIDEVQELTSATDGGGLYHNSMIFNPNVGVRSRIFPFPITGVKLTLSSQITDLHGDAADRILITARDHAHNHLETASETVTETGRPSVEMTTPANVFGIGVSSHEISNPGSSDSFSHQYPALRLDGGTSHA